MKLHVLVCSSAVVAAALLSVACQSTPHEKTGKERFDAVDANKDGRLSLQEIDDRMTANVFNGRDKNQDKKLTWEEWNVPGAGIDKAKFLARDRNKDGFVSYEEAIAYSRKHGVFRDFSTVDTNKDGFVSFEEAQAYYASKE